mmetsp:Transcript_16647/g.23389  ORF Transcript_16647/g.23389 Transcript_16647/m.23389 type:complete len:269 (-) Transcript_16647:362-1168(-)
MCQTLNLVLNADGFDVFQLEVGRKHHHFTIFGVDEPKERKQLFAFLFSVETWNLVLPLTVDVLPSQKSDLHGVVGVVLGQADAHHRLIVLVFVQRKTIVDKESAVAFPAVAVIHLCTASDGCHRSNDKPISSIVKGPLGFFGDFVVKHISVGHQTVRLVSFDGHAKNTCDHHETRPHEFFVSEKGKLGTRPPNVVILPPQRINTVGNLLQRERALKQCEMVFWEKDRHVGVVNRKNVEVGVPEGGFLVLLLQQVGSEVAVFAAKIYAG